MLHFLLQQFSIIGHSESRCLKPEFREPLLLPVVRYCQLLSSLPWGSSGRSNAVAG